MLAGRGTLKPSIPTRMETAQVLSRVRLHYWAGDNEHAIQVAEDHWAELQAQPLSQPLGLVCTYARLACYRLKRYEEGDMWWQRGFAAWRACGYLGGLALLLITPALRSVAVGELYDAPEAAGMARMILQAAGAITEKSVALGEFSIYTDDGLLRHAHQHLAYVDLRAERFGDAVASLESALFHARGASDEWGTRKLRGELQVGNDLALARFFSSTPVAERAAASAELVAELERIAAASASIAELADIHELAERNLRAARLRGVELQLSDVHLTVVS